MRVRVVVADQAEASFFDALTYGKPLRPAGELRNPSGRLLEREFTSDRPGRTVARSLGPGRSGASHAVAPERTPRKRAADLFARRIAAQLERDRRQRRFDRLVIIAGPAFLGHLRAALPPALSQCVADTVVKDLAPVGSTDLRRYLRRESFTGPLGFEHSRAAAT
jgi:protein required for attachment to host cells